MSTCEPIYTTLASVKVRLVNKVQFQVDPDNLLEGELPNALLLQLITDAETTVELDLRSRYAVPFRSKKYGNFDKLPDHTRRAIRMVVDMQSVIKILDTDFGRGTHINAAAYKENTEKAYKAEVERILGRDPEAASDKRDRFRFSPPLDDLVLAPTNREADDGYKGMIINTDGSRRDSATYAEEQVNNPAASYVNRRLDAPENPL